MPKSAFATMDQPPYNDWETISPEEKVRRMFEAHKAEHEDTNRFSTPLYHSTSNSTPLRLLTVETPTPKTSQVVFIYTIPNFYANPMNNLHGAAHSLIYDNCTTLALAAVSAPGFWRLGGVSRVLDVKYLRAARVGEEVKVEVEVIHVGGNAAAIRGVMKDSQGRVLSTCEHDKTNIDPKVDGKPKL